MVKVEQAKDGHFFIQAPTYPSATTIRTWEVHPKGVDWLRKNRIAIGQEFDWEKFRDLKDFGYAVISDKNPKPRTVKVTSGRSTGRARKRAAPVRGVFTSYYAAPEDTTAPQSAARTGPQHRQRTPDPAQPTPRKSSKKKRGSAHANQGAFSRQTARMDTVHAASPKASNRNREQPDHSESSARLSTPSSHNTSADPASSPAPVMKRHHTGDRLRIEDKFTSEETPPHLARKTKKRTWFSHDD